MEKYFSNYSDDELINIAFELDKVTYPENSIIRTISKDLYNADSKINCLMIAVPLSKELASRLKNNINI